MTSLLAGFLVTVAACLAVAMPQIEADLGERARASLSDAGFLAVQVEFEGREARLTGAVEHPRRLHLARALVESIPGVRVARSTLVVRALPRVIVEPMRWFDEPPAPVGLAAASPDAASPDAASPDAASPDAASADAGPDAAKDDASPGSTVDGEAATADSPPAAPAPAPATPTPADLAGLQAELDAELRGVDQSGFFRSASPWLMTPARVRMKAVAAILRRHPDARVQVEGHTDAWGSLDDNRALSLRRARAIVAFLVGEGVEASRLEALGLGEAQPIGDNRTQAGRAQNRRIEILVEGAR